MDFDGVLQFGMDSRWILMEFWNLMDFDGFLEFGVDSSWILMDFWNLGWI